MVSMAFRIIPFPPTLERRRMTTSRTRLPVRFAFAPCRPAAPWRRLKVLEAADGRQVERLGRRRMTGAVNSFVSVWPLAAAEPGPRAPR